MAKNAKGARLLSSAARRKVLVTLQGRDGPEPVEVREPTVGEQSEIAKAAANGNSDKMDIAHYQVTVARICAFDPETGQHLWEKEDADALKAQPAGFLKPIAKAVEDFLSDDAQKDVRGKSEGTPPIA